MTSHSRIVRTIFICNCVLIIVAIILGFHKTGNPARYFGEGRFTTAFSCAQLLGVAWFSIRSFFARWSHAARLGFISEAWLWACIAAGFVFLAADDAFQFHEHMDKFIHHTFHIVQTPLTDRIDDALIGLYGIIGMIVLWLFRRELLTFKLMHRPMIFGFIGLFLSVLCDTVSNDETWLSRLSSNLHTVKVLDSWFSVGDGAFTLWGEGFFLAAFYLLYRAATELDGKRYAA